MFVLAVDHMRVFQDITAGNPNKRQPQKRHFAAQRFATKRFREKTPNDSDSSRAKLLSTAAAKAAAAAAATVKRHSYTMEINKTMSMYKRFEIAMHRNKGGTASEAFEALILLFSNPNLAAEGTAVPEFINQTSKDPFVPFMTQRRGIQSMYRSPDYFTMGEILNASKGYYDRLIVAMLKFWPGIGNDGTKMFDRNGWAMTNTTTLPNACKNNFVFAEEVNNPSNTFRLRWNVNNVEKQKIQVVMEHEGETFSKETVAYTEMPGLQTEWVIRPLCFGEAMWTIIGLILERAR